MLRSWKLQPLCALCTVSQRTGKCVGANALTGVVLAVSTRALAAPFLEMFVPPVLVTVLSINWIRSHRNNARTHSAKQIRQLADSIRQFGYINPPLLDEDFDLIAGHARVEQPSFSEKVGRSASIVKGLSEAQKRALRLADNLALSAGWDREAASHRACRTAGAAACGGAGDQRHRLRNRRNRWHLPRLCRS